MRQSVSSQHSPSESRVHSLPCVRSIPAVVAGDDITQGLPRVEELFEARKPKGLAIITEFGGVATIKDTKKKREIIITNPETGETKTLPDSLRLQNQGLWMELLLEAGDELTEGSVNPHDILKDQRCPVAVQDYMIQEVQRVYRLQGVEINDKHIEVIVRQMLKRVHVEEQRRYRTVCPEHSGRLALDL